jgi:hypothetical protein
MTACLVGLGWTDQLCQDPKLTCSRADGTGMRQEALPSSADPGRVVVLAAP